MTKEEAIKKMDEGLWVRHAVLRPKHITAIDGRVVSNKNKDLGSVTDFFSIKFQGYWEEGWEEVEIEK